MFFNHETREVLLQKQFIQLIQENSKIESRMLYVTDPWCLPFLLVKKTLSGSMKYTYNLEMVFKHENHEVLLQKQFMQLIQENPKIKTPMLYFEELQYLPFQVMKKMSSRIKENMYKLEMFQKRENHEVLLKKQFMQLIQENPKIKSPMLYFTDPWYLPFLLMKKTLSG